MNKKKLTRWVIGMLTQKDRQNGAMTLLPEPTLIAVLHGLEQLNTSAICTHGHNALFLTIYSASAIKLANQQRLTLRCRLLNVT